MQLVDVHYLGLIGAVLTALAFIAAELASLSIRAKSSETLALVSA